MAGLKSKIPSSLKSFRIPFKISAIERYLSPSGFNFLNNFARFYASSSFNPTGNFSAIFSHFIYFLSYE